MRIVTCNVNGIRSAHNKGFLEWLPRQRPDFACLQEIKAREADLPRALLAPRATKTSICTRAHFSDHAPLVVDYDYEPKPDAAH